MVLRQLALLSVVVVVVMPAKAQTERRMTVDELFQLVESNSKTLQEQKISVEFAQKGIEAARAQRLPDVNASL
ncbi:MAG: TolC family protein, partial [Prevotella sp.]|nr:TolC family protein [Prevotella sp.]